MHGPPGNAALTFRPLVSLDARRIIGFTAHAQNGDDVLRAACCAAAHWPNGITLGIELSTARWQNPATGLQIFSALNESGLTAARLELEIAADALAGEPGALIEAIERVRHSGLMVALTGCGRAAETAAPVACFDTVKFAATFVQRLGHDAQADMIADTIIRVADQYGVIVSADGIATNAQLDLLNGKGCAEGQGPLFGKAYSATEVSDLLAIPSIADAVA